jgi:phosphate acetyltransferase
MAIQNGIDISALTLVEAEHSIDSAARAVELVQRGDVDTLMQGDLHVCELMGAVAAHNGGIMRGGRISHCFIADLPGCSGPQIIMDASAYGAPTPDAKARVIENTIELAQAMRISEVQITILSTMETIASSVPSTGTLTAPGDLFRPAGCANVLVLPDLTAAETLVKSLSLLAGAEGAGMVLGARVPIILRSRTDSRWPRIASCAIVSLLAEARCAKAATNAAERTSVVVGQLLTRDRHGENFAGAPRGLARAA